MFAEGMNPEQVLEALADPAQPVTGICVTPLRAEKLFEKYLALSMGEKLRLTLMTECVSNRLHRLMDDISDLNRIDALLEGADEKTVVSLLDIKRKIKERMAKEYAPEADSQTDYMDEEVESEIDGCYEKIFGSIAPETKVH